MKKAQILIISIIVASMALFSFKSSNSATRYGGTASVSVKAGQMTTQCNDWQGKVKEGDTRVIEVSTTCTFSNSTDAKAQLQQEIKYKMACYEKQTGSINYDIDTCN